MLLSGIVAATLMLGGSAVVSLDSGLARMAAYKFYRWQRRRRCRSGEER